MNPQSEALPHPSKQSFAILGAGRIGVSLGYLLSRAGYRLTGCFARSDGSAQLAEKWIGPVVTRDLDTAAKGADCLFLTVPDGAISNVCDDLVSNGSLTQKSLVLHTAGAFGLEPLRPAIDAGAQALAFHPLQSVPDVESGIENIPGSWVGLTCRAELVPWAAALAEGIGCRTFEVPEERRGLYHAAAAIASNYLVTLTSLVTDAFGNLEPFIPAMRGTLANVERAGPVEALTGAIVRGDVETLRRHLNSLEEAAPKVVTHYKGFGRATLDVAWRTGKLSDSQRDEIDALLDGRR
jgi:predicted short-subunit dehydrogenase-like oxidoreductase (DUF2520 family)